MYYNGRFFTKNFSQTLSGKIPDINKQYQREADQ